MNNQILKGKNVRAIEHQHQELSKQIQIASMKIIWVKK